MKKGLKMTLEQRKRISESMKGKTPKNINLLHKKAVKFQKGQIPWNKNMKIDRTKFPNMGHFKKNSEETKRRISEATKKAMINPEIRRKISDAHKGKHLSEEHKKKLREYIPWMKGKHHSEEAMRKIIEANRKRWNNPEYREKMSLAQKERFAHNPSPRKGTHASQETLRKLSVSHKGKPSAMKGKHHTEEVRIRLRKASKEAWANSELRKKMLEANMKRYNNPESLEKIKKFSRETILRLFSSGSFPTQTNTKPERKIKAELIKRGYKEGVDFIHQYKFMNKFMCDFCFPLQKIIVEVYGDFWHANPKKYAGKELHPHQIKGINRDKAKEAYIKKVDNHSWTYLALWESDIKKDIAKCVDIIEEALAKSK